MDLQSNIVSILQAAENAIRSNMESKGINASHRTEQSLRTEAYNGGARLIIGGDDTAPLETLEIGRPAGAVPHGFAYIIWDWMQAKGIASGMSPKDQFRIAGAIAYGKIAKVGTDRYMQHEDVYSTIVNETAEKLKQQIGLQLVGGIKEIVNTNFK